MNNKKKLIITFGLCFASVAISAVTTIAVLKATNNWNYTAPKDQVVPNTLPDQKK